MNQTILIGIYLILFITGCGEEKTITDKNTQASVISVKGKEEAPVVDQSVVESKQRSKDEIPEEEPLEGFAAPKSEEELADEQSTDSWEIEEEISVGKVPDKSEKELLDENLATRQPSSDQKSAEELADEKLN